MLEVDSGLQGFEVDGLEDWLLLDLVEDDAQARFRADRRKLRLGLRFIENNRREVPHACDASCVTDAAGVCSLAHAGWEDEVLGLEIETTDRVDTLGGVGTPLVGIPVPVRWAEATGRSLASAKHYLAGAMDLAYRFPRLHARIEALDERVPVWKAMQVCEDTRGLSFDCAAWIDARLDATGRYGVKNIGVVIKQAIASFHPELLTDDDSGLGRGDWDVTVDHHPNGPVDSGQGGNGTTRLEAVGDSVDLGRVMDAVNDHATTLGRLGDTDSLGQRRAKSLGHLADLQATLDYAGLLDPPTLDHHPDREDHTDQHEDGASAGHSDSAGHGNDAGHRDSAAGGADRSRVRVNADGDLIHPVTGRVVHRRRSYGKARVYVHLNAADLVAFAAGVGESVVVDAGTRLGPQTLDRIHAWLQGFGPDARITPVIDLNRTWVVDQHDPPTAMRKQVVLRDPQCVFPHCTTPSQRCDLDHIRAYDDHGPPGQTNPENLAPLCRRHHLMKTHYDWVYHRNTDGTYAWTSPTGRAWLVTPEGAVPIHDWPIHD